ncbi:phage tail protein [Fulvivirga ligni]|uniref:phage tail protein n=1 Tax=Fulvivirga ligni TaxID=2904246 RepID=UPI001F3951E7|nr:tail fiber protein [Fulvivirga ligni]UII19080.1 tail fiber protein [Fulvivirga ligni]
MEGYLSEIRYWAPTWIPRNWAACGGQLLPINTNQPLFSLISTIYGGDGRTSFALPDLRGRVAIGPGEGNGLTSRIPGQASGQEYVYLTLPNLPQHNHLANTTLDTTGVIIARNAEGTTPTPASGMAPGKARDSNGDEVNLYTNSGTTIDAAATGAATTTIGNTGGSQDHNNMQPFLVVTPIICISGIYPSRS